LGWLAGFPVLSRGDGGLNRSMNRSVALGTRSSGVSGIQQFLPQVPFREAGTDFPQVQGESSSPPGGILPANDQQALPMQYRAMLETRAYKPAQNIFARFRILPKALSDFVFSTRSAAIL
jgi:hypothetical protein